MDTLKEFFLENDHFARHCGITLLHAGEGFAEAEMIVRSCHKNGAGTVHGGAIFTLADFVFAVAANSHGKQAVAINTSISFMKPVLSGTLTATAKELDLSSKLGNYQVQIFNDKKQLVAQFHGTAFRKENPTIPASNPYHSNL